MGLTSDALPLAKVSRILQKHNISPYQIAVGCTCVGVGVAYAFSSDSEKGKYRAQKVVRFMTHKVIPKIKDEQQRRERMQYDSWRSQGSGGSYYSGGGEGYGSYQGSQMGGHSRQHSQMSMDFGQQQPPPPPGQPPMQQGQQYPPPPPPPQGQYYSQDGSQYQQQQYASWNSQTAPPPVLPAPTPVDRNEPAEQTAPVNDAGSSVTAPSDNEAQEAEE